MNTKLKFAIPILALCIVVGVVIYLVQRDGSKSDAESQALRQSLRQAVEKAKAGDRTELEAIIKGLRRGDRTYISENLLPDYVSFLKDEDGEIQLLGAESLCAFKGAESKNDLCEYVQAKERHFTELAEKASKQRLENLDRQQLLWEQGASSAAILALGKIGDKSVIPFLESLRAKKDPRLDWANGAVEKALAEIGSVKSLSDIPESADDLEIGRAGTGIAGIRDPNKVPELMATAKSASTATGIRCSALDALAAINSTGVPEFIVGVMVDANVPERVRWAAAIAAGKTKAKSVEKPLLAQAENQKSDTRAHALAGLVIYNPEKYMDLWFEKIMDPTEDLEFRTNLAHVQMYIQRNILREHKNRLYECLNAADGNGQPIDMIRLRIWQLIDQIFQEQPIIVLSSEKSPALANIKGLIRDKIMRQGPMTISEENEKVSEKLRTIVRFFPKQSEVK